MYIPGTLIIKALMALIVSLVPFQLRKSGKTHLRMGAVFSSATAELLMVSGYWFDEAIFIGEGYIAALAGASGNIVQGIVGAAGAYFLLEAFSHTGIFKI